MTLRKLILPIFLLSLTAVCSQDRLIRFDQAYGHGQPSLTQSMPRISGWLNDNTFLKRITKDDGTTVLMSVNARTAEETEFLSFADIDKKMPGGYSSAHAIAHNKDYSIFLFRNNNDLYVYRDSDSVFKRLTDNMDDENNVLLSPDGKKCVYERNHNLFVADLVKLKEKQITESGNDVLLNGRLSWVYYEEIFGRSSNYKAFWWSPDSKKIAFLQFDERPTPEFPLFDAEGVHGRLEKQRYPKPGDPLPIVKLVIVNVDTGEFELIETNIAEDRYIAFPMFTPSSDGLIYQVMPRSQEDIYIIKTGLDGKKKDTIYSEHQDSWVNFFNDIIFSSDGQSFYFISDKNNWANVYKCDIQAGETTQITKFDYNVTDIDLLNDKTNSLYLHATGENSTETHLFKVDTKTGIPQQLTKVPATHRCNVSPEGSFAIDEYSSVNFPRKRDIVNCSAAISLTIDDTKIPRFDNYNLGETKLFTIPTSDGMQLPALAVYPPNFDPNKKYPVIFKVYGGPGIKSVRNQFRNRRGEYDDYYLAANGIVVMAVDNRGSGHFGKENMALMHRVLGKYEVSDLVEVVKWLRKQSWCDQSRIGVSGGSYGGYTTLMCLTAGSDYFTHGIAAFSVTDWRLYDNIYTERYMDLPNENMQGYDSAAVMTYLDKYKGGLLITHGTMDDNVHMQNTIQLIGMMQDMGQDFELMLYPNERHGLRGAKRVHEYRLYADFWFRKFFGRTLEETIELEEEN